MVLLPRGRGKASPKQPLRIFRDYRLLPIPARRLRRLAELLLEKEGIRIPRTITVIFCSDRKIKTLNTRYRKISRPTDVLSFAIGDPDFLGEIYISLQRAAIQSRRYGVSYDEEVFRLFIHGFLHLLGYDHEKEPDRLKMERKEREYINKVGS